MSRTFPLLLLVLCMVCFFGSSAKADSIVIGQLQFLGTENGISGFKVTLDTNGITASPLSFSNTTLLVNHVAKSTGPLTTPLTLLFTGGPGRKLPACPCNAITFELLFPSANQVFSFVLANGQTFKIRSIQRWTLHAPLGQRLRAGDSIPITLISVPEPETLLLVTTGMLLISVLALRGRFSFHPLSKT